MAMVKKTELNYFNDALFFFNDKKYEKALLSLKKTLERNDRLVKAYILKVQILFVQGQWQELYDTLQLALAVEPTHATFLEKMAVACERLGKTDEAQTYREKLGKSLPTIKSDLKEEVLAVINKGRFEVYLEYLASSVREDSSDADRAGFGRMFQQIAFVCLLERKEKEAFLALKKGEICLPEDILLLAQIEYLLRKSGNEKEAEEYTEKIKNLPKNAVEESSAGILKNIDNILNQGKFDDYLKTIEQLTPVNLTKQEIQSCVLVYQQLGNYCMNRGNVTESIQCFERALNLDKTNPETLKLWGDALLKKSPPDEEGAKQKYSDALAFDSLSDISLFDIAYNLYVLHKHEDAIELYLLLIDKYPDSKLIVQAYNNIGASCESLGDLDKAIQNYQKSLKIDSSYSQARYNLGITFRKKKDNTSAISNFNELAQDKEYSLKATDELLKIVQSYQKLGESKQAIGLLKDIENKVVKEVEHLPLESEQWTTIFNIAYTWAEKGINDHRRAINLYKKYTESDADKRELSSLAFYNMGISYEKLKEFEQAESAFKNALAIDWRDWDAFSKTCGILSELYKLQDAIDLCRKWLENNPDDEGNNTRAKLYMAEVYAWYLADKEEAKRLYNEVFGTKENFVDISDEVTLEDMEAYVNFLRYNKDYNEAMDFLNEWKQRFFGQKSLAQQIFVCSKMMVIHSEKNEFTEAKSDYQEVLKLTKQFERKEKNPSTKKNGYTEGIVGIVSHELAYCLNKEGKYIEAQEAWERTMEKYDKVKDEAESNQRVNPDERGDESPDISKPEEKNSVKTEQTDESNANSDLKRPDPALFA